jgi:uncharacterized membrane protein YeiH
MPYRHSFHSRRTDHHSLREAKLQTMPQAEFQVPMAFDYFATFLWALSGAIVGMHKRYDFAGVAVIALLSATGGGLIRDGIFLQRIPFLLLDTWYLPLILLATTVVAFMRQRIAQRRGVYRLINVIDAIGVPAFAVVGMQLSLRADIPLPGVVLVGVVNGFGGGILRDLVVGETPSMLMPGQFAITALLFVSVLFVLLVRGAGISNVFAAWGIIVLFFTIRMLSIHYNWQTKPVLPDTLPKSNPLAEKQTAEEQTEEN